MGCCISKETENEESDDIFAKLFAKIARHEAIDMESKGDCGVLNLMDLPTEVIEKGLFPFLMHNELKRMRLNRRLKDIANSVIEVRDRKCTKLLIAGGNSNDSSYILHVYLDGTSISQIKYENLPNLPHFFENAAFGSFRGRTIIMGGRLSNGQCLEFDQEKYKVIPSLNINRWEAASTFIHNKIVISGGYDGRNITDFIEVLDWDEFDHGSRWMVSPSRLPIKVRAHTLVTFNNKLYVIGGEYENFVYSDKIWEGTFDSQTNKISWIEMGSRLQKTRYGHFSFVISSQIIIFGGCEDEDVVEIIEGNELKLGPKIPFELDAFNDHAVLDRKNRIIITSNDHGLIVYDHQNRTFEHFSNFKVRETRNYSAAILQ